MGILPLCSSVSTSEWLHHSHINETLGEKGRYELHMNLLFKTNSRSNSEQNSSCTASYFLSYKPSSKMSKTYFVLWRNNDKLINDVLSLLWPDTGCSLEDLPRVMTKRDGWKKRVRGIRAVDMPL